MTEFTSQNFVYLLLHFTDYLFIYCFTSQLPYCFPKMLYRIGVLFPIRFTGAKIRIFFGNANKS